MYIWDYVVNFDNYMDFYPILNTTKENLQSYKKNGVSGLFLHGSGYDYSILEEVKYYVLASLLNNSNSSVNDLILEASEKYYPEISQEIYDYLTFIESLSTKKGIKQNIYSGVSSAQKRYLTLDKLIALEQAINKAPSNERLQKLKTGILFLELELYRINGLNNNGYGVLNNQTININPIIKNKLIALEELVKSTGLNFINEKKETFSNYLNQWEQFLFKTQSNSTFYSLTITSKTILDVDYSNVNVLNDGAYGFEDYNNNWLIYSGRELNLEVNHQTDDEITKVELSFLSDLKHKIFLPSKIQVLDNNKTIIKEIDLSDQNNNSKKRIEIINFDVTIQGHQPYTFKFINSYKSIAIDEIRFLK